MILCPECKATIVSISDLVFHLQWVHNIFVSHGCRSYFCHECSRDITNYKTFRQHLMTVHKLPENGMGIKRPRINETDCNETDCFSSCSLDSSQLSQSSQCTVSLPTTSTSVNSNFEIPDISKMKDGLRANAESFLNHLYAHKNVTRKFIQTVVSEVSQLVNSGVSIITCAVKSQLLASGVCVDTIIAVDDIINEMLSPFSGLHSDYLRIQSYRKDPKWVDPQQLIVGDAEDFTASKVTPISVKISYLSLSDSLRALFESPGVLMATLNFMNELSSQPPGIVSNVVQSRLWKSKIKDRVGIHIPIFLYSDSFQVNNSLGPHSDTGKLDGVYALIPVLPPSLRSLVDNIIVILLFKSYDRELFTNASIFQKLVSELNELGELGLTLSVDGVQYVVYFHLAIIIGDNLGLNSMFDLVSCFTANYCCRLCKIHRDSLHFATVEDPSLLRNQDNYLQDIITNDSSVTGIIRNSIWNDITNFHITENPSVDVMHDLLQGVCHYDMAHIIRHLVKKGYFTLSELNFHISCHDYGCQRGENKPSPIRQEALDNFHFKMSAKEMLNFMKNFSLMVGHLVPKDDPVWYIYILLRKILDIVLSPVIYDGMCDMLESHVQEHHDLYVTVFKDTLKPKHHFLVHYARVMREVGPAVNLWCMRCESKHRAATVAAHATQSRKNIIKTLSIREQITQVTKSNNVSSLNIECGMLKPIDIDNTDLMQFVPMVSVQISNFQSTNFIVYNGLEYKVGWYVNVKTDNYEGLPVFGKISHIILNSSDKDFRFFVKLFDTEMFCDHFHAYLLNPKISQLKSVTVEELVNKYVYHGHFTDKCIYVSLPHFC